MRDLRELRRPVHPERRAHSRASGAQYLFGPGERGEHVDAHVMAGGSVLLGDRRGWDWIADMRFCVGLRPGVSRPVWHCCLRAAPQDRPLDDPAWAAVAGEFVAALGLARYRSAPQAADTPCDTHLKRALR
jgi:hypothetical protein